MEMKENEEDTNEQKSLLISSSNYGAITVTRATMATNQYLNYVGTTPPIDFEEETSSSSSGMMVQNQDKYYPRQLIRKVSSLSSGSIRDLLNSSLRLDGALCSSVHLGGTATVSNEIFNLIKNIVGCGVLSLPSGIAAFGNTKSAIIPAIVIIFFTGAIFGYYFLLLGRICRLSSSITFRDAWENTIEHGANVVSLCNLLKPAMANLSYSIILADTLK